MGDAMYPAELRYYQEHQWVRQSEDGTSVAGITFFAQEQLGEIVYVDLPEVGMRLGQFDQFGEIESVKTVSDMFMPVGGEVIEINRLLSDSPALVNTDPYGEGWMLRIRVDDAAQTDVLLTAEQYERLVNESG